MTITAEQRSRRWARLSRLCAWLTLLATAVPSIAVVYVFSRHHELGYEFRGAPILALIAITPVGPLLLSDRERAYRASVAILAFVLMALVILTGFSIGHLYIPAAGGALSALVFDLLSRPRATRGHGTKLSEEQRR